MSRIHPTLPKKIKTDSNNIHMTSLAQKLEDRKENAITSAIHFFDKTIFTNPGPATEHDSIISDGGRFLTIAYTNQTHINDPLPTTSQLQYSESEKRKKKKKRN